MRYLIICQKCGKEIKEVTAEYLHTYYKSHIFTDWDWEVSWANEKWRECRECVEENSIIRHGPSRKDLRYIATKDERENKRKVNSYKRKKKEAKYREEW